MKYSNLINKIEKNIEKHLGGKLSGRKKPQDIRYLYHLVSFKLIPMVVVCVQYV